MPSTTTTAMRARLRQVAYRYVNRARGRTDPLSLRELGLRVGERVYFAPGTYIDSGFCWLITIGDDVTFAPQAMVLAHDASTRREMGYTKLAHVRIGNGVFVGARAVVLPGVTIGDGATIAAGSVVRDDVEPATLVAGSPARPVMRTADYVARQRDRMAGRPTYDRTWTVSGGIDHDRREQMRAALADGPGFVK